MDICLPTWRENIHPGELIFFLSIEARDEQGQFPKRMIPIHQ
jgi:hypothetical protein